MTNETQPIHDMAQDVADILEQQPVQSAEHGEPQAADAVFETTVGADASAADNPVAMIEALSAELKRAREEVEQEKDINLRLQADFTNFRKRKEKELSDGLRHANADMAKTLLPLLDDMERAINVIEKTDNLAAIKEGIEMVQKNFIRLFGKIGVEPIADPKGHPFDSLLHEAITTVPADAAQKDLVVDVAEKGYKFQDKVIRFTKVVVGE